MINLLRRKTGSASREDQAGYAGLLHFYLAHHAGFVDHAYPVSLYACVVSRILSCNFPADHAYPVSKLIQLSMGIPQDEALSNFSNASA